jgi:hypothetical protein
MLNVTLAVPLLAAIVFVAAGCGGSSKTASTATSQATAATTTATAAAQTQPENSGPALSSSALITKADLICARLNAVRASTVIKSKQELIDSFTRLSADEQRAVEEMSRLTAPSSLTSTWNSMLAGYRTMSADTARVKQEVTVNKNVGPLVAVIGGLQRQTAATAASAGFKDCARI